MEALLTAFVRKLYFKRRSLVKKCLMCAFMSMRTWQNQIIAKSFGYLSLHIVVKKVVFTQTNFLGEKENPNSTRKMSANASSWDEIVSRLAIVLHRKVHACSSTNGLACVVWFISVRQRHTTPPLYIKLCFVYTPSRRRKWHADAACLCIMHCTMYTRFV